MVNGRACLSEARFLPISKITFIRPNMAAVRSADAMQPLAFAVLAGLTPPDVEIELIDERLEPIPYDSVPIDPQEEEEERRRRQRHRRHGHSGRRRTRRFTTTTQSA